jgi:putative hemolysin
MNEKSTGDNASPNNGDQPPSLGLLQLLGIPAVLVGLFLVLRPQWVHQLLSISGQVEGIRLEFWLAVAFLVIAVAVRYALEQGETALASITSVRVAQLLEKRARGAKALRRLIAERENSFMTIRTGSLALLNLSIVVSVLFLGRGLESVLGFWFPRASEADLTGVAYVLAFLLSAGIMLLVAEVVPRSVASAHPETSALRRASLLLLVSRLLALPVAFMGWLSRITCKLLRVKVDTPAAAVTEEQLRSLLETSGEQGELEEEERHMLHSVFDFTDTIVREVMTPRTDMDTVAADAPLSEIVRVVGESGHSRIPIYVGTVDTIIGVVHAKDLLAHLQAGKQVVLRQLMRPVYVIPENKKLGELLAELRATRNQLAIVQDEYGGTSGLVTIEDIVEEIVGEIVDEYDVEEPLWLRLDDGSYLVDGKLVLHDLNEVLGAELESEEFDTIGGLVFGLIGHQPACGEEAVAEPWQFRVTETDGRRITKVLISHLPEPEEAEVAEEQQV